MKVLDKNGKEMPHPNDYKDTLNDSMTGAIQLMNYKLDYEQAKRK